LRNQRDVVAAERTIDKRLLEIAGFSQYLVANPSQRQPQIHSRFDEEFDKR
jgi:hypothetical protein